MNNKKAGLIIFSVFSIFLLLFLLNFSSAEENFQNPDFSDSSPLKIYGYIIQLKENPLVEKKIEIDKLTVSAARKKRLLQDHNIKLQREHSAARAEISKILEKKRYFNQSNQSSSLSGKIIGNLIRIFGFNISGNAVYNIKNDEMGEFYKVYNGIALNISEDEAEEIKKLKNVKEVYPNFEIKALLMDSVPLINADDVWLLRDTQQNYITGRGIKIAIIDSGVDYTVSDFGSCTTEQFLAGNCAKVKGGYDFYNKDNNPIDDFGHGTHVAGIASGNDALLGVAPDATIYAVKVIGSFGGGSQSLALKGVEWAVDPNNDGDFSDKMNVISLSLGFKCFGYTVICGPNDPLSTAVDNAVNAGIIAVVAAGNEGSAAGTITSPGTARKAITVGASYKKNYDRLLNFGSCSDLNPRVDQISCFSSRGPVIVGSETITKPDLLAPGAIICSAHHPGYLDAYTCTAYGYPQSVGLSGTSQAAPHVSGITALIKQAHPYISSEKVKKLLMYTAKNLGYDVNIQGYGRVDALRAIQPFVDVPYGYWAQKEILSIFLADITSGCKQDVTGRYYCPTENVTRAQMAVFLVRAMNQQPYNNPTPTFVDVPATHSAYGHIEKIYQLGITSGCKVVGGKKYYCPNDNITRADMAVFLSRAAGIPTYNPLKPTFADVPRTHPSYIYIEGFYKAGITSGCKVVGGKKYYCPSDAVKRDEMSIFLTRAFKIPI